MPMGTESSAASSQASVREQRLNSSKHWFPDCEMRVQEKMRRLALLPMWIRYSVNMSCSSYDLRGVFVYPTVHRTVSFWALCSAVPMCMKFVSWRLGSVTPDVRLTFLSQGELLLLMPGSRRQPVPRVPPLCHHHFSGQNRYGCTQLGSAPLTQDPSLFSLFLFDLW